MVFKQLVFIDDNKEVADDAPIIDNIALEHINDVVFDWDNRVEDFPEYNTMEMRQAVIKCHDGKRRPFLIGFTNLPIGIDYYNQEGSRYEWYTENNDADNYNDSSNDLMLVINPKTYARYYFINIDREVE